MLDVDLNSEGCDLARYIIVRKTGFYLPAPEGQGVLAALCPVEDAAHEPIDICAWLPGEPERWWLRTGAGVVLGEWEIQLARDYGLPVRLVATPHQWLEEYNGPGDTSFVTVCVLRRSAARALLRGLKIIGKDQRHAA